MATSAPTRFCTDYAKRVAKCQKCKMQLEKGVLRMGKIVPNFFVAAKDSSKPPPDMKQYFHKNCLFEMLFKARPTTKVIEQTDEIEGFDELSDEDQADIAKLVDELVEKRSKDGPAEPKTPKTPKAPRAPKEPKEPEPTPSRKRAAQEVKKSFDEESPYNSFHKFIQVCSVLKELKDTTEKTEAISQLLKKKNFDGDLLLWLNFLIRSTDKRAYNVTDEQLIQHFSKILDTEEAKIQKYVSKSGDLALSIGHAHEKKVKNEKCGWSLQKVDRYLEKLAGLTEQDAVLSHLKFAAKKMRNDEVEMVVRLIRKELDTETDEKTILKGVHQKAFAVFEKEGVEGVVERFYNKTFDTKNDEKKSEPKAKKSKRHVDSDEESDVEISDSESEGDVSEDSDGGDSDEISGSDSDDVSEISSEDDDDDYKENKKTAPPRGTRTRPRGDDGAIVKQETCPDDMEPCKYGAECYRKNEEHKERFWHPAKN